MGSPLVALINLLSVALESGRKAKAAGDNAALFGYIDLLDIGQSEARDYGVEIADELKSPDPYSLMRQKN